MPSRQPYFECVFVADRNEYRFHFRSPSAEEAERHLCEELREWGLALSGVVCVFDRRGRVVRRAVYEPDALPPGAPAGGR